jgi:putative SbcD/Mre11-related phosphoesterase
MRWLDDWLLTPARAAIHLPTRTAVVADLHLGYDRVRHRGGEAVPHRAIAAELAPLRDLLRRESITRLVVAGDLFEDARCARDAMLEELRAWLIETGTDLVAVVPGNHDRGLATSSLPVVADGVELGRWRVVHGDRALPDGPCVQGHEHPCLRWRGAAGPCYLVAERHLVLPAYSADAAGGNVLSSSRWAKYRACAIAGDDVLDFGEVGELRGRLAGLV